jgi:endonuclease/exonuclease/phosphatase family metal-dependent hydrolase
MNTIGSFYAPIRNQRNPFAASQSLKTFETQANAPKAVSNISNVIRLPLTFSGNSIKVMSYNTENFFDNIEDPNTNVRDIQWAKSEKSIKALAEVIQKEKPDILALQEVENERVLQDLNQNHLGGQYNKIVMYPTNDQRGIRVAYMCKNNVKVVDSKSHRNEKINGNPVFARDLLEATFETESGSQITLFNTHWKSMAPSFNKDEKGKLRGKGKFKSKNKGKAFRASGEKVDAEAMTTPRRMNEAKTANRIIEQKIDQNPNIKIMMVGDLNTLHSRHGEKVLTVLRDPQDPNPNHRLVEVLEKDGDIPPTHEGGKHYPDSKLDYCFVSPNLVNNTKAYVAGQMGQNPWKTASDHLPIVAVIDLDENEVKASSPITPSSLTPDPQALRIPEKRLSLVA